MNEPVVLQCTPEQLDAIVTARCNELLNIKLQELSLQLEAERETMTAEEVMNRLKIKRTCLYRLSIDGLLKPIAKLGRQRVYSKADVEQLLKNKSTKYFTTKNYEKAINIIGH